MSNYLQAYRVVSTGIVDANTNIHVSNAEKAIEVFGKLGKALPL